MAWAREERRAAGWQVTIGGEDRAAVKALVLDYLRRWPAQGYDTRIGTVTRLEGGGFLAVGSRLASSD